MEHYEKVYITVIMAMALAVLVVAILAIRPRPIREKLNELEGRNAIMALLGLVALFLGGLASAIRPTRKEATRVKPGPQNTRHKPQKEGASDGDKTVEIESRSRTGDPNDHGDDVGLWLDKRFSSRESSRTPAPEDKRQ